MDPSISDESAFTRETEQHYDPKNPHQAPYEAVCEGYRAEQLANRRITVNKETLADLCASGREHYERAFRVHGTMADLRWTDPTHDRPTAPPIVAIWANLLSPMTGRSGWRASLLCSWLSQWSDVTPADGLTNAARVSVPAEQYG